MIPAVSRSRSSGTINAKRVYWPSVAGTATGMVASSGMLGGKSKAAGFGAFGPARSGRQGGGQYLGLLPLSPPGCRLLDAGFNGPGRSRVLNEFTLSRSGHIEIAPAGVTQLNVLVPHHDRNLANRLLHVTTGADLVSHYRHPLLPPNTQPIIVPENGRRDLPAQFGNLRFHALAGLSAEFERLQLQQAPDDSIHEIHINATCVPGLASYSQALGS